nr:PEP-CTERM sorting domain-containing protein [uncultured Desulfobacter sp.]
MKNILLMVGILLGLVLFVLPASAAVITFDGLSGEIGSSYTESGFTLTADDDSVFYSIVETDVEAGYSYTGSETLMNNYATATTLTSTNGSLFNLTSIDLAEAFNGDALYATSITFDAVYSDGSTYSFTLTTDGNEGAETFTFGAELTNLASLSFGDYEYVQFDNVTASAVPVPSSILLLVAGTGVLVGIRRKFA